MIFKCSSFDFYKAHFVIPNGEFSKKKKGINSSLPKISEIQITVKQIISITKRFHISKLLQSGSEVSNFFDMR